MLPRTLLSLVLLAASPAFAQTTEPTIHTAADLQQREARLTRNRQNKPHRPSNRKTRRLRQRLHTPGSPHPHRRRRASSILRRPNRNQRRHNHPHHRRHNAGRTSQQRPWPSRRNPRLRHRRRKRSRPPRRRHRPHPRRRASLGQGRTRHHHHLPRLQRKITEYRGGPSFRSLIAIGWVIRATREHPSHPRNCLSRNLPPTHEHGSAVTINASGYQCGPNSAPRFHVTAAPAILTTNPMTPPAIACSIGLSKASRAAM